jgi:UDP:flavonoid glycosyltransferase YjiC (YdhE family)
MALNRRAVIIASDAAIPQISSANIMAVAEAPLPLLLARAEIAVHLGNMSTLAESLRAGCPMLLAPHSGPQTFNSQLAVLLQTARILPFADYRAETAEQELRHILNSPLLRAAAQTVGRIVQAEDGLRRSCAAIEATHLGSTSVAGIG